MGESQASVSNADSAVRNEDWQAGLAGLCALGWQLKRSRGEGSLDLREALPGVWPGPCPEPRTQSLRNGVTQLPSGWPFLHPRDPWPRAIRRLSAICHGQPPVTSGGRDRRKPNEVGQGASALPPQTPSPTATCYTELQNFPLQNVSSHNVVILVVFFFGGGIQHPDNWPSLYNHREAARPYPSCQTDT